MEKLTGFRSDGVLGRWLKEAEGINQKYMYITYRHRQQCGDSQRESRMGARWRWTKGRKNGDRKRLTFLGMVGTQCSVRMMF